MADTFDPHAFVADFDPNAFAGARPLKYPQPKSFYQSDEEVGIGTGPISSARLPGTALSIPLRPSMSEVEFDQRADQVAHDVGRVERAAGAAGAGGLAGAAGKAALAGATAPPWLATAGRSVSHHLGHATTNAILGSMLGHGHGVAGAATGAFIGLMTPLGLRLLPMVGQGMAAALPAEAAAAGAVASEAVGTDVTPTQAQGQEFTRRLQSPFYLSGGLH